MLCVCFRREVGSIGSATPLLARKLWSIKMRGCATLFILGGRFLFQVRGSSASLFERREETQELAGLLFLVANRASFEDVCRELEHLCPDGKRRDFHPVNVVPDNVSGTS